MLPIPGAVAESRPAIFNRLKAPSRRDFKFIRGHLGRDGIRISLPSGGVGFIATTISQKALAAFARSLARKIAKGKRRPRAVRHEATFADQGVGSAAEVTPDTKP